MTNEMLVALRVELAQLAADRTAIAGGNAGSTVTRVDKAKFDGGMASLKLLIAQLEADDAKCT